MLTGTADPAALADARGAATIGRWPSDDVVLEGVVGVQMLAELRRHGREALLPVGLHPTDPPSLHIQVWAADESPWGPFAWAFTRLSCRSGARARALTTASVVTSRAAADGLAERFGFAPRVGDVSLRVGYDAADASVEIGGEPALRIAAVDPTPLPPDAVQATSTLTLAHTPAGLRLVQVEAKHTTTSVERVRGALAQFAAAHWGDPRLDPYDVVSTVVVRDERVVLPAVRFVCRPDVSAFEGTERVADLAASS